MIPERYMKQALRLDNGGTIKGYYRFKRMFRGGDYPIIYSDSYFIDQTGTKRYDYNQEYRVDPSTIEDVTVKPIMEYEDVDLSNNQMGTRIEKRLVKCECPNCNINLIYAWAPKKPNYCDSCGMRLDWNGEE